MRDRIDKIAIEIDGTDKIPEPEIPWDEKSQFIYNHIIEEQFLSPDPLDPSEIYYLIENIGVLAGSNGRRLYCNMDVVCWFTAKLILAGKNNAHLSDACQLMFRWIKFLLSSKAITSKDLRWVKQSTYGFYGLMGFMPNSDSIYFREPTKVAGMKTIAQAVMDIIPLNSKSIKNEE